MDIKKERPRVAVVSKCAMSKLGVESLLNDWRFTCQSVPSFLLMSEIKSLLLTDVPDVIVITVQFYHSDIHDVVELIRLVKQSYPEIKIVVMLDVYIECMVHHFLAMGVQGVTGLNQSLGEFEAFFLRIAGGCTCYSNDTESLADLLSLRYSFSLALSDSESRVLNCLLAGYSVNTSAVLLSKSKKTIASHKASAMKKLGLKNYSQLVAVRTLLAA